MSALGVGPMSGAVTSAVRVGPLVLYGDSREVFIEGRRTEQLTRTAWDLLLVLALEPSRVVSHQELIQRVWAGVGDRTLVRSAVHRLRRVLNADGHDFVQGVRGCGYRLTSATVATVPQSHNPTSGVAMTTVDDIRSRHHTDLAAAKDLGRGLMRGERLSFKAGYTWRNALGAAVEVFDELGDDERLSLGVYLEGFARGMIRGDLVQGDFAQGYNDGWLEDPACTLPGDE